MKRKTALIILSVIALMLCSCKEKNNPDKPNPDTSSITSENEAPGGFSDEGPVSWDE
ncbi:MAG: hypothetical protein IKX45_06140 [Bacteroidales bacterium]|nr:hypothetical protein [Bacteroidales bacterium]